MSYAILLIYIENVQEPRNPGTSAAFLLCFFRFAKETRKDLHSVDATRQCSLRDILQVSKTRSHCRPSSRHRCLTMAALNRPTEASYEVHESVKVDTSGKLPSL